MIPAPHDPVAVVWIVGLIIAYLCIAIGARLLSSPFDDDAAHALGHVTMGCGVGLAIGAFAGAALVAWWT